MSKTPAHKVKKVIREGGSKLVQPADKKSEKSEDKVNGTSSKE